MSELNSAIKLNQNLNKIFEFYLDRKYISRKKKTYENPTKTMKLKALQFKSEIINQKHRLISLAAQINSKF